MSRSTTLRRIGKRLPRLAGLGRLLSRASNAAHASLTERLEEMREVLRAVDVVTAPSRFLCERMAALGIPGLTHVPLGHAPLHVPRREADPAGRLRFGYLGALIPSKGVHVLAEAFRLLDDPRAALSIHGAFVPYHGGAGYEARVRSALGHYAGVTLQGSFSSDELGQKLAGLDVLVVPSLWAENAPLVVSEAFLARVPVIVSDLGGLREMVRDEVDGLRVPAGDPSALASAMRRFLEEPGLGVRLASQAPAVPTMAEHAQAMEELYARARARFRDRSGRIGVVVLEHGASEQTARALRSTRDSTLDVRALVVENGCGNADASDGPRLRLPTNRGFAGGMNAGIQALMDEGCDRFLLLNNDATLEPGCLRRLAEALEDPCLAAVGPVILRESDGRVESRGVRVDLRWGGVRLRGGGERAAPRDGRAAPQALSGAVIMLSRAAVERVGLMDEAYFFSFEDVEWCLRARSAGLAVAVILGARARHGGSCTIGRQSPDRLYYAARNHLRLVERHLLLPGLRGQLRRGLILGRHLGHALRQGEIPRWRGMRAVVAGFLDGRRGRFGQRSSGTTHD